MTDKRKLNQTQNNNRSALMLAGQNSLLINGTITNQNDNFYPAQSQVVSVYKRQNKNQQQNYSNYYTNQNKKSRKVHTNTDNNMTQQFQNTSPHYLELNSKIKKNQIYEKSRIDDLNVNSKSRYYTQNNVKSKVKSNKFNNNQDYYGQNQLQKYGMQQQFNTKRLMMKLTLPRLRKMQALVRGFLVRRKVYPKVLEEYLVADSVLSLIEANVIYKESSAILLESITFPKYQGGLRDFIGDQQMLQNVLYDKIIERVIQKQLPPIIQESIIQKGVLMSRPQITFGLNLRSPVQLLLYQKIMNQINYELKIICQESIRQQAAEKRELLIIDDWIIKYQMLNSLYKEIVDECLEQNVGEYVVQSILERMNRQACYMISENTYNKAVLDWYNQEMDLLTQEVEELLFQELISGVVLQNMERHNQKQNFLND